jgi:hypothetical protein
MGSANVPNNDFVAGAVGCVLVVLVVVVGEDGQATVSMEELVSVPPTPM